MTGTAYSVAVARNQDGRLELFAEDGASVTGRAETAAGSDTWTAPTAFPGYWVPARPAVSAATNANWLIELIATNANGVRAEHPPDRPQHRHLDNLCAADRHGLFGVAVASNQDGRLELFGADGSSVTRRAETAAGSDTWTAPTAFPGYLSTVSAATNANWADRADRHQQHRCDLEHPPDRPEHRHLDNLGRAERGGRRHHWPGRHVCRC